MGVGERRVTQGGLTWEALRHDGDENLPSQNSATEQKTNAPRACWLFVSRADQYKSIRGTVRAW